MTIRARLLLALAVSVAAIGGIALVALLTASDARRLAHEPVAHVERLRAVHAFSARVAASVKESLDVAYDGELSEELPAAMAAARAALAEIDAAHDPLQRGDVTRLRAAFAELERQQGEVLALIARGDHDGARAGARALGEILYEDELAAALSSIDEAEVAESNAIWRSAERDADARRRHVILIVVLAAAALAAGGLAIVGVQRRLTTLAAVVGRVGHGDLAARSADVAVDELGAVGRAFNDMAANLATMMREVAAKEALASELALASRLQLGILPRSPRLRGLEIHGEMRSAAAVGGDYYDVIETERGGWITIGDVSGHGFHAGMVMMMAQSAIGAAVRAEPEAAPSTILRTVNRVLYDNLRRRVGLREHMTLTVMRYDDDGRVAYAGAHLELLLRAPGGDVELVATEGAWMAVVDDVAGNVVDRELQLAPGAALVLHTDGLTEARRPDGAMLGLDALAEVVARTAPAPGGATAMCRSIMAEMVGLTGALEDDATVVVLHRTAA